MRGGILDCPLRAVLCQTAGRDEGMVLFRSNKGMLLDLNSNALALHAQFAELDAHNSG
jgi:hypothetical protein